MRAEWRHRLARGAYSVDGAGIHQLDPDRHVRRATGAGAASSAPKASSTSTKAGPGAGTPPRSATTPSCAATRSTAAPRSSAGPSHRLERAQLLHRPDPAFPRPSAQRQRHLSDRDAVCAPRLHLRPAGARRRTGHRHQWLQPVSRRCADAVSHRQQARRQSRALVDAHWQRRMVGAVTGQVVTPFARVRGDVYVTEDLPGLVDPSVRARRRDHRAAAADRRPVSTCAGRSCAPTGSAPM
jgi:hypothetical protein